MHSCEVVRPPCGTELLLQLTSQIIRSRGAGPAAVPLTLNHQFNDSAVLFDKVHSSNLSCDGADQKPYEKLVLARYAQALWRDHIPICIEVFLAPDCRRCKAPLLLLETWTMSIHCKKPQDHNITSEWLLNAVRSQLHFSQISAWNEKLKLDNQTTTKLDIPPSDRPRKLSRENCNFKKYESNCDEEELLTETKLPTNKPRKLNIVYNLKIPRESYEVTEFQYKSTKHYFPITDIGNNVYLRVCLQSLPRVEDIPTLMCMCIGSSNPGTLKRRRSKDLVNALTEEVLALNMVVGTSVDKCKGQVFPSDSIGVINPDKGCSSSFSLSTFANPSSRGTTPEQSFPCSENKPCKRKSNTDSLYKYIISGESIIPPENNVIKANFVLVDDRMQTPCREKGKHRCIFDEENDQGQKSEPKVEEKKVILDEKRAKEIAKYMRRLRKESKLKQLKESSSSSGDNSECYNDKLVKNKTCDSSITKCTTSSEPLKSSSSGNEGYTCKCCGQAHKTYKTNKYDIPTSIPILQASRFDYVNRFSSFRTSVSGLRTSHNLYTVRDSGTSCDQMAYVRIRSPESCQDGSCTRCCDRTSSSDENYRPSAKKLISSCTQTEDLFCDCGKVVTLEAKPSKMKRSEANHDLAKSESLRQEEDDDDDDEKNDDEEVIYNKCDNSVVITRHCDITDNANCQDKMEGLHSSGVDDTCVGIIRKPRLKRLAPMVDKIDKIIMERNQSKNYKNEDRENSPLPDQMCTPKRKNTKIVDVNQSVLYEKGDYKVMESADNDAEKKQQMTHDSSNIPSVSDMDRFRYRLDSAASMVFHSRTGLPLTSSPAPLRRGKSSFDFDSSINSVSGIKSALYGACNEDPDPDVGSVCSPGSSPGSPNKSALETSVFNFSSPKLKSSQSFPAARNVFQHPTSSGLLGSFEESVLNGRLEPAATVAGFTAEIGASGSFCPPHLKLPVTVFFYSLGDNTTSAPYLGHINLGRRGYCVPRSGTIQATLFNPHGTVVKMFVVMYDLSDMPPYSRTFLRQRTLCMASGSQGASGPKCLRYLIHLRFLTSKSGKVYLHTDIRIIVSRKADLDTAHSLNSALALKDLDEKNEKTRRKNQVETGTFQKRIISSPPKSEEKDINANKLIHASPIRSRRDSFSMPAFNNSKNEMSYELRSFTYGPENPKYSPR